MARQIRQDPCACMHVVRKHGACVSSEHGRRLWGGVRVEQGQGRTGGGRVWKGQ